MGTGGVLMYMEEGTFVEGPRSRTALATGTWMEEATATAMAGEGEGAEEDEVEGDAAEGDKMEEDKVEVEVEIAKLEEAAREVDCAATTMQE